MSVDHRFGFAVEQVGCQLDTLSAVTDGEALAGYLWEKPLIVTEATAGWSAATAWCVVQHTVLT
jgi:hypothetical protein